MINANADAMGIIFPNNYDKFVPELVSERLMASIPFASRYRMIDFFFFFLVGCGIDKIEVLVRENYHSLVDHLGGGREWDLSRKNGGLSIFPPFAQKFHILIKITLKSGDSRHISFMLISHDFICIQMRDQDVPLQ